MQRAGDAGAGEGLLVGVLGAQGGEFLLAHAIDFLSGKARMEDNVGEKIHPESRIALQHGDGGGSVVMIGERRNRGAGRIERLPDLHAATLRGSSREHAGGRTGEAGESRRIVERAGARLVIFRDDQVLGYRSALRFAADGFRDGDLIYGRIEIAQQKGDDQLAQVNQREVEDLREPLVEGVAPDCKARLERTGITLKACVNYAAVGLGHPETQLSLFFEKDNIQLVFSEFVGEGCAHNAAAYDEDVCFQMLPLN